MKKFLLFLFLPSFLILFFFGSKVAFNNFFEKSKIEVIRELEKQLNIEVFPAFAAQEILVLQKTTSLLPLTGPSNSWVVFCKENHDYLTYKTDRHGFHNPDSLWDLDQWESAFLGDSFVQGACVDSNQNFVRLFEKTTGPAGNLGSYGNGPLSQLASLIEYAKHKKPKKIFWFYTPNDLYIDLSLESENSLLMGYLHSQSQNLIHKQQEVDLFLREYLQESKVKQETAKSPINYRQQFLSAFARPSSHPYSDLLYQKQVNWSLFLQVLQTASAVTESWKGQLYFVILPHAEMLLPENQKESKQLREHLTLVASQAGAQVIDLTAKFEVLDEPLTYFELLPDRYGHFNVKGYEMVSQFLNAVK